MKKASVYKTLLKISFIFTVVLTAWLALMITARPASAQQTLNLDAPASAGWHQSGAVADLVRIISTGTYWQPYSEVKVTFGGQPVTIVDADDNPLRLITDATGKIPNLGNAGYFFRVPWAKRGINQMVFSGTVIQGVNVVAKDVLISFYVGAGINVSRLKLPDWSTSTRDVGQWLNIYGTGFGLVGADENIVILWDGSPWRYYYNADGDGRWEASFPIPETEGSSSSGGKKHVIEVFSKKQPIDLARPLPDPNNLAATGRGSTNSQSNGVLLPVAYRVRPHIELSQDHGRPNDRLSIYGTGFKGTPSGGPNTIVATVSLTMSMYTSAPYIIPTTDANNNPVTVINNSKGSFTASIRIPASGGKTGPAILQVWDSAGNTDDIPFNIDDILLGAPTLLTPATGSTFLARRPTFTWSPVAGAPPVTYEMQIDNNADFSSPARWTRWIGDTDWTVGEIDPGIYYWRVRAVDGASPYNVGPWSSAFSFTISNVTTAAGSFASGWSMFSSPVVTESGSLGEMLALSDINLNLYTWDASQRSYVPTDAHDVGKAYWVKARSDTPFLFEGALNPSDTVFSFPLNSGWNQISDPYGVAVNWNDVRVSKDGSITRTIADAHAAGWMNQYIYNYNPATRSYDIRDITNGVLKPHEGYWVKINVPGLTLVFQPA